MSKIIIAANASVWDRSRPSMAWKLTRRFTNWEAFYIDVQVAPLETWKPFCIEVLRRWRRVNWETWNTFKTKWRWMLVRPLLKLWVHAMGVLCLFRWDFSVNHSIKLNQRIQKPKIPAETELWVQMAHASFIQYKVLYIRAPTQGRIFKEWREGDLERLRFVRSFNPNNWRIGQGLSHPLNSQTPCTWCTITSPILVAMQSQ